MIKNLLFGFGGTAIVGGIGYGIYSSTQSNIEEQKEEKTKIDAQDQKQEDEKPSGQNSNVGNNDQVSGDSVETSNTGGKDPNVETTDTTKTTEDESGGN